MATNLYITYFQYDNQNVIDYGLIVICNIMYEN